MTTKRLIIIAIAFILKAVAIMALAKIGLDRYNPVNSMSHQHVLVWLLVYLPIAMGFESLISVFQKREK